MVIGDLFVCAAELAALWVLALVEALVAPLLVALVVLLLPQPAAKAKQAAPSTKLSK
jgi:hypothetical protein